MKSWLSLMAENVRLVAGQGLDLLCPPRCVFCRSDVAEPVAGPAVVCDGCRRRLCCDVDRCPTCGSPTTAAAACRGGRCRGFDGLVVLSSYADDVRRAVLATKRPGGEPTAAGLAGLLVERHRERLSGWRIDLVVPVPMHWMRRLARGANAAHSLAQGVASALALPCRPVLVRSRFTRMQNSLPPAERRANVDRAFRTVAAVAGRRVLLVDDVTTTGGTLTACRKALLAAGAGAVYAAAVARADALEAAIG